MVCLYLLPKFLNSCSFLIQILTVIGSPNMLINFRQTIHENRCPLTPATLFTVICVYPFEVANLLLGLPSGRFQRGYFTKILYLFLVSPHLSQSLRPDRLNFPGFTILMILGILYKSRNT